jgi:FKBP-type peptidyl-prolyl cis-trans isomerase FkpA
MRNALLSAAALLLFAACDTSTTPASTAEPATDSGDVGVRIIRKGYGRSVEAGDVLTVHTTGWLYDESAPDKRGEKFWSSLDTGDKLTFTLGAGQMIRGWDVGLPGMLIGEVRELTIPPELGYGESGRGPIPPDSTLVFEVELFDALSPGETTDGPG